MTAVAVEPELRDAALMDIGGNSADSWGVRTLKAFLILLALQHNVQQVVEVSTETSSGPPSHSVEVEDPDPPAVPPAP